MGQKLKANGQTAVEPFTNDEEHEALVELTAGLLDMINGSEEGGEPRLDEADIPDDFQWLKTRLDSFSGKLEEGELSNDEEHDILVDLVAGLQDMVQGERLMEGHIPDDYQWLVLKLSGIEARLDAE